MNNLEKVVLLLENVKLLVVYIDKNQCKIKKILDNFKVLTKYLSIPSPMKVYYALVESRLRYAYVSWGKMYHRPLQMLQKCPLLRFKNPCRCSTYSIKQKNSVFK